MVEVLNERQSSSLAEAAKCKMQWKRGICGICPAGCWVEAGLDNGRLVDIRKDDSHPLGMICRRGEHAPEIVYSEHRLMHPLKRVGPKGTHQFERISWDDAYKAVVENLSRIKLESGPEALAIYTGRGAFELSLCDLFQPQGVAVSSASSVLFPFGSPNTMGGGALCYVSFAMIAPHVTMGRMLINMFVDMENAELLVVWGNGLVLRGNGPGSPSWRWQGQDWNIGAVRRAGIMVATRFPLESRGFTWYVDDRKLDKWGIPAAGAPADFASLPNSPRLFPTFPNGA